MTDPDQALAGRNSNPATGAHHRLTHPVPVTEPATHTTIGGPQQ